MCTETFPSVDQASATAIAFVSTLFLTLLVEGYRQQVVENYGKHLDIMNQRFKR